MRSARAALVTNARAFFDAHLGGLFAWDSVAHDDPESLPELPNGRRNPLGRYREHLVLTFGGFKLAMSSPEDDPPLGWVACEHMASGAVCEGPLDSVVWSNIGNFIKEKIHGEGWRAAG